MSARYISILSLQFRHSYYRDTIMRGITLHPFAETARLIRNYRLTPKMEASQFRLIQENRVRGAETEAVVPIEKKISLAFGFRSNDPEFQPRTEIEFYSSNRQKMVIDLRNFAEEVFTEPVLMPVFFGQAVYVPKESVSGNLELRNKAGDTISRFKLEQETSPVVAPMPEMPEDLYSFFLNDEQVAEFLLLHTDSAYEGIILADLQQELPLNKTISFAARKIFWQYSVEQKYNQNSEIELVDETDSIVFEKTQSDPPKPGTHFISTAPVTLSEQYPFRLQIMDNGRVIRRNVPNANLKNIGKCLQNVHYLCLENYVLI